MGPSGLCRTILAYTGLSTYIGHMLDTRPCAAIYVIDIIGVPKGIRTPVTAVKGRCPGPLDDGDAAAPRRAGAEDYTAPERRTTRVPCRWRKSPPRSGWATAGTGQRGGLKGSELKSRPDVPKRSRQVVRAGVITVQRAGVADRRIRAKKIVPAGLHLEPG